MVYRFLVAFIFTFVVFPFVAMFALHAVFPEAHAAFDRQTWLQGLVPIAAGWLLFLSPGFIPFVGSRYYPWVARKTGLTAFFQSIGQGIGTIRRGFLARLRRGRALVKRPNPKVHTPKSNPVTGRPTLRERWDHLYSATRNYFAKKRTDADIDKLAVPNASRERAQAHLDRARNVIKDAPKHISGVRHQLESLRDKLTPDELQRTIDLNSYTIETFGHLKRILSLHLPVLPLDETDSVFCRSVIAAIPEPRSPSAVARAPAPHSFNYPEPHRAVLYERAVKARLAIRNEDFVLAEQGDLERGLLLTSAIVADAIARQGNDTTAFSDELILGLPMSQSG